MTKKTAKKAPRKKATKKRAAKKATPFRPGRWHVNQGEAAEFCGIAVQVFQRRGIEPSGRAGRSVYYDLRDLMAWEKKRAQEAERRRWEKYVPDGGDMTPAELLVAQERAKLALTEEQAETQRLKNAELRRELAPVETLTWALGDLAAQIGPLLTPIPAEIKRRIPKVTNAELHVMREIIANALNLCAEARLDFDAYEPDSQPAGN